MLRKVLILLFGFMLVLVYPTSFAQQQETLTVTTYYPSPYGSYKQLEVSRSVTYDPVDKDTLTNPKEGELVYNSSDDAFYYYNGSDWVKQGGGNYVLLTVNCPCGGGFCVRTYPNCPNGWTVEETYLTVCGSSDPDFGINPTTLCCTLCSK